MRALPFIVALLGAGLASVVDIHATEVQPAVLVIAIVCMGLGFGVPRLAWLWALIVGSGVFVGYVVAQAVHYPVKATPEPNAYASLVALIPALIAAYIGASARWIAGPGLVAEVKPNERP